ncbi:MAG: DUF4160 domain-containing protein [Phycisphaerales bacterium]|nr:DUF4160 domain-containing protein [Phycisphaerales bacterium]
MPEISRFLGIVVAIYYNDHEPPHFHIRYGSQKARFAIDGLNMIDGDISPRIRGLVVEGASLHQDELRHDWNLARKHDPLLPIEPLE